MAEERILLSSYKGENKFLHFIGCGGIGTKPLMKIFSQWGYQVSGSDMEETPALAKMRAELGAKIFASHQKENLPSCKGEDLLIIYSSAIREDNVELMEARNRGAKCILRGEALSLVAQEYPAVVAVSGTHGKTSTSALLLHMLEKAGYAPGFLIGGNLPSRFWNGEKGEGKIFICEADESDGTHSLIKAECAVMTNLEEDHIWNFSSREAFYEKSRTFAASSRIFIYGEGEEPEKIFPSLKGPEKKILVRKEELSSYRFPARFGPFQKFNALLAALAAEAVTGEKKEKFLSLLSDFPGVERRMTTHYKGSNILLLEDYAHHPTELKASLEAIRALYGEKKKLTLLFQPHRYARLEKYFEEFAQILSTGENAPEKVFLPPVFAAWTEKGKVTSRELAERIGEKASFLEDSWEKMAEKILAQMGAGVEEEILAVIGAGDVRKIIPLLQDGLIKKEKEFFRECGVVFACGGSSSRFGRKENKLLQLLGDLPVFLHSIRSFAPFLSGRMVLVIPKGEEKIYKGLLEKYLPEINLTIAYGGECREESVKNGLLALPEEVKFIAIHDGARPFASPALLQATFLAAMKYGGGIASARVTDTIKEGSPERFVLHTPDRSHLYAVQTPQTFRKDLLWEAFRKGEGELNKFTDDSSLVEAFTSCKPLLIVNESYNPKITYSQDCILAKAYWDEVLQ